MKLVLKARDGRFEAKATYNPVNKECVVKKGSKVSQTISECKRFTGRKTIQKLRDEYVKNGLVTMDVVFKSSSTAANFVTGSSTNGMVAWKDENGNSLRKVINQD